jgi:hypothetical protein
MCSPCRGGSGVDAGWGGLRRPAAPHSTNPLLDEGANAALVLSALNYHLWVVNFIIGPRWILRYPNYFV